MKNQNPSIKTLNQYLDKDFSLNRSLLRTRQTNSNINSRTSLNRSLSGATITSTTAEVAYVVPNNSRPIVLAQNKQVVELETSGGLGYNSLNFKNNVKSGAHVPLFYEQQDIGMSRESLHPKVPILGEVGENKAIVVKDRGGFKYPMMRAPEFEIVDIPAGLIEGGPNLDRKLMTAQERREISDFTKQKEYADLYFSHAIQKREKVVKNLNRKDYQRGVPSLYSTSDQTSEIYGQKAREQMEKEDQKNSVYLERATLLAQKNSSIKTHGNIIVPESLDDRVSVQKQFRKYGGTSRALTFDETHNRIFNRRLDAPFNPVRAQMLRNNDLSGKDYNIVSHTIIHEWPSEPFQRLHDKRLDHPSQASLEDQRNMQGSTIRLNRSYQS